MFPTAEEHERSIWRLIAFLARFGHQQATETLKLEMTSVVSLAFEVGEMMREESEAIKHAADGD